MKESIYHRTVSPVRGTEPGEAIVLTREVNRLMVWSVEFGDHGELNATVLKTFELHQTTDAIEFAVDTAREAVENRVECPSAPFGTHVLAPLDPQCIHCGSSHYSDDGGRTWHWK